MTTQPSTPTRRGQEPGGARYLATVLGLPAVVLVTGLGLVAWSWSLLPAMVASHWGPDGVDGTQDRLSFTVTAAVILVVLSLLLAGVGWLLPADGRRLMAVVVGATSGFVGVVLFGAMLGQRGVADPTQATLSPWLFVASVVIGTLLGAVAWALNPVLPRPDLTDTAMPSDAPRIPAGAGERLVWFGWTASGRWVVWVCLGLVALGWVVAVIASPWATLGPVLGIVLVLLSARARVVVDADGLRVTSAGVLPWLRVPLDTVAYAERSELQAFREFGGLGLRFRPGARAFVTRSGEALRVVQRDGTRTYVSMDDAEEAAAVLNTLVRRGVDA